MREGTASRVMPADRPNDQFYDFYSVSPEYFALILVHFTVLGGSTGLPKTILHEEKRK
jgi:hypothetical protein